MANVTMIRMTESGIELISKDMGTERRNTSDIYLLYIFGQAAFQ